MERETQTNGLKEFVGPAFVQNAYLEPLLQSFVPPSNLNYSSPLWKPWMVCGGASGATLGKEGNCVCFLCWPLPCLLPTRLSLGLAAPAVTISPTTVLQSSADSHRALPLIPLSNTTPVHVLANFNVHIDDPSHTGASRDLTLSPPVISPSTLLAPSPSLNFRHTLPLALLHIFLPHFL